MNEVKQIEDYCIEDSQIDWDKMIDDYTPYVNTIINNMAYDLTNEDKEEILLDVFFVLWKSKGKKINSLDAYIAGITRNLVKERFRKRRVTSDISSYENFLVDTQYNMYIEERVEIEQIERQFKNLKEIDLKIVNMFYYSSKSTKEIAKELNISEFNVNTRLYRIRKKIKKHLNIGGM